MTTEVLCVRCGEPANLMCSRCFERYCGRNCQISDWYIHKKVCKEMPNLISTSIIETFTQTSQNHVIIQGKHQELSSEATNLQAEQNKLNQSAADAVTGEHFLGISKTEDITKLDTKLNKKDDNKSIQAVESANHSEAHMKSNYKNSAEMPQSSSDQADHKKFENDVSSTITKTDEKPKAVETTKKFEYDVSSTITKTDEKPKAVETTIQEHQPNKKTETLKTPKSPAMMATLLKTEKMQIPQKRFFTDLMIKPLPEGKNVKLIVTDTSFIYDSILAVIIRDPEQLKLMAQDLEKVSDYCETVPVNKRGYDPKNNELCLAIFEEDEKWYRASCINEENTTSDNYTLQFIDYGNLSKVPRGNILPITEDLMFPTYNNLCRILNEPEKIPKLKIAIDNRGYIDCNIRFVYETDMYEIFVNNLD